jgi:lipoyl(octanoyl) transferase
MTLPENTPAGTSHPEIRWLGRIGFKAALELQEQLVRQRREQSIPDTVLLLEHEPVYTIGRTRDRSSLLDPDQLPHDLIEINRGGKATYHGPGQLVGYFVLDLHRHGRDLHALLRMIEGLLIDFVRGLGIAADCREGLTGVWVDDRKLASIGVGVRHWVSMHGFAINICGDLSPFESIIPCGIEGVRMTSVERELSSADEPLPEAATATTNAAHHLATLIPEHLGFLCH